MQYFLDSKPVELNTLVQLYETAVDEMSTISYSTGAGTLGNVTLSFRGKLPKQGVGPCEDAYITFLDYPHINQAIIIYSDGDVKIVKAEKEKILYDTKWKTLVR